MSDPRTAFTIRVSDSGEWTAAPGPAFDPDRDFARLGAITDQLPTPDQGAPAS